MLGLEVGGSGSRRQLDYKRSKTYSLCVVDIGAKTDYDALDPDVDLNRACCHGGPSSFGKRMVSVFPCSGAFYQCHINLI